MVANNLVTGGRIAGVGQAATAHTYAAGAVPMKLSRHKAPFLRRHRLSIAISGAAFSLTAFIVLLIVKANVSANMNRVNVLLNTSDTYRAQSVYIGQDTETFRLVMGIIIFATVAIWLGCVIWVITPPMQRSVDAFPLVFIPIFGGIALVVTAGISAASYVPGMTDTGKVYDSASTWLELQHNIPYDVANYMQDLRGDDAYTSFAHTINVTTEFGVKEKLTISRGGADQSILTLHLKAVG